VNRLCGACGSHASISSSTLDDAAGPLRAALLPIPPAPDLAEELVELGVHARRVVRGRGFARAMQVSVDRARLLKYGRGDTLGPAR